MRHFIGKEIIYKFRKPEFLITDGGTELTTIDTNLYLTKNRIKYMVSSSYHPQSNERAERLNDVLVEALIKLPSNTLRLWADMLPTMLMVCQNWVNHNKGKSSYKLVYGNNPVIVSTKLVSQLPLPKKVPIGTDPNVQRTRNNQETKEKKELREKQSHFNRKNFKLEKKFGSSTLIFTSWN